MTKILITGGNGVVGRALLKELSKNSDNEVTCTVRSSWEHNDFWYDWTSLSKNNHCYHDIDLTSFQHCQRLIKNVKPDIIYHLAATSTSSSTAHKVWQNTEMTLNLLETCRFQALQTRFIQASSMSVEASPPNVYTASKLACEDLVYTYGDLYGLEVNCVRFPAIVGVGARHGLLKDLIKKVFADGDTIELFGNRTGSVKPFLFSEHLAEFFITVPDYPTQCHLRVSPVNSISVETVANIVMEQLGRKKEIVWNESKVWIGDQQYVAPIPFEKVLTSEEAIVLATKAILKEEYGK